MSVVCHTTVHSLFHDKIGYFHFEEIVRSSQASAPSDINSITIWFESNEPRCSYQTWNGLSFMHDHKSPFQRTVAREIWNHLVSVGFSIRC
jgi:hypothetical protein